MKIKKQVLVVEDNLINREILTEILSDNYTVLQADNGETALDILKQNKDSISLILLDVMMPVMDGYTFLDKKNEDSELATIPVIVMTQSGSEDDEVSALEHGATDFVPKPYRPSVILHRIESLIRLRETSAMVNQFKYDRLTGLYSKEYFYQKVRELLLANPDREYSIVCSNIENFKLYNDVFGVQAGDAILKENAEIFRNMVGENGFCGRYGADRLIGIVEQEKEHRKHRIFEQTVPHVSISMKHVVMRWGIYEISDLTVSVEQMCDRALLAVDSIKGQYNQYYAVYDDELRSKLMREKSITDAMESALSEEQFEIYFQPKYSLKDNFMVGAEALVRWVHPEWGFMSPGEFIPLFEKNGFIPKLDKNVWERVCKQLCKWREAGYPVPVVSVNVSRADIYQSDLVDTLLELTQKYKIEPPQLHLEITESAYAENPGQIISTVEELRKLGFIVEMDDFGSGYSSLNMLSRMHLDILKLDMKFIQNEISKPGAQSILNEVISMAHKIHLSVVAEGVETREQMERLQSMGCDYAQGYFFAKPMTIAEFEKLWIEQSTYSANNIISEQQSDADMCKILVADEDASYRERVRKTFSDQYGILEASDADGAIEYIKSYGKDGISAVILSMTLPEDGAASIMKVMRRGTEFWNIPVLGTIPSGESMEDFKLALEADDFLCKRHPMIDLRRRVRHLSDLTMLRKREKILQDEASRDPLTNLLNRRGFEAAINSLCAEDFPLSLFFFDLDNLKTVNDTHGHEAGDRTLRAFAEHLSRNTRMSDICCRYGGDEFAVIMKQLGDARAVMTKGQRICSEFRDYSDEKDFVVSTSGGAAICGSDTGLSDIVFERADKALYRAKRENKGNFSLWEE